MHHKLARPASVAVFPDVDALPSPEGEAAGVDGDGEGGGGEGGLDVGGHVVGAFGGVGVERIAFRHEAIEPRFKVASGRRVGVLLYGQARGGVANHDRTQSRTDVTIINDRLNIRCDLKQTLTRCDYGEGVERHWALVVILQLLTVNYPHPAPLPLHGERAAAFDEFTKGFAQ